jgi:hypothetical protein
MEKKERSIGFFLSFYIYYCQVNSCMALLGFVFVRKIILNSSNKMEAEDYL